MKHKVTSPATPTQFRTIKSHTLPFKPYKTQGLWLQMNCTQPSCMCGCGSHSLISCCTNNLLNENEPHQINLERPKSLKEKSTRSTSVFKGQPLRLINSSRQWIMNHKMVRYFDEPGIHQITRIEPPARIRYNSISPFGLASDELWQERFGHSSNKSRMNYQNRMNAINTPNIKARSMFLDNQNNCMYQVSEGSAATHKLSSMQGKFSKQLSDRHMIQIPRSIPTEKVVISDMKSNCKNYQDEIVEALNLTNDPFKTGNKHFYNMLRPTFYQRKLLKELEIKAREKSKEKSKEQVKMYVQMMVQLIKSSMIERDKNNRMLY